MEKNRALLEKIVGAPLISANMTRHNASYLLQVIFSKVVRNNFPFNTDTFGCNYNLLARKKSSFLCRMMPSVN